MRVALCLLTRNEIEGCRHDVPRLPDGLFDCVFCVDGHSTDGTAEYLTGRGIEVIVQRIRGYNGAYIEAFEAARSRGVDAVVFYHPKGSIDPAALGRFGPCLERGAGLVIASRLCRGAVNEEDSRLLKPRKWFVVGLGTLAWLGFGRRRAFARDVLHGCRGMRVDAFERLGLRETGVTADLEMVVGAYRMGLRIEEFPVEEKSRLAGETHFRALPTGWGLLKYMAGELVRPRTGRGGVGASSPGTPAMGGGDGAAHGVVEDDDVPEIRVLRSDRRTSVR